MTRKLHWNLWRCRFESGHVHQNTFCLKKCRGVAQPGRVHALEAWSRRFESGHPDHSSFFKMFFYSIFGLSVLFWWFNTRVTPLPIPNRVVKPCCSDDTPCGESSYRQNKTLNLFIPRGYLICPCGVRSEYLELRKAGAEKIKLL